MSYLEFLLRPFNLPFLGAVVAGAAAWVAARRTGRDLILVRAGLVAFGVVGLTLTGAVHDLGLGSPAGRLPEILAASFLTAAASAWGFRALRDRFFPPVRDVRFNEPGLEGVEARVVSDGVDETPASGRAHWHDGEGALHLVSCHSASGRIGFGESVRLEEYDDEHGSYRVRPV